jgi:pilus assembly protein CpaB
MKFARIAILGVALLAGLFAWVMSQRLMTPAPVQLSGAETNGNTSEPLIRNEILVARHDIPLGAKIDAATIEWAEWPNENVSPAFITRSARPEAIEEFSNAIATTPIFAGEPIKENNVVRQGRGFMSAILPSGKRAISIRVQNESRAAGFILPNDRIDVILTRLIRGTRNNAENYNSETILSNVRVLAIDQTFEERDGEKYVTGEIATLELTPREAELLAMADQMGELSLALRSVADLQNTEEETSNDKDVARRLNGGIGSDNSVNMIKFGISAPNSN